jgi:hypothetical protein
MATDGPFIRWFEDLSLEDVPIVGGKNASVGEMYRELSAQGVRVPNGFAVTAAAYRHVVASGEIGGKLEETLAGLDTADFAGLARRGRAARDLILGAGIPPDLWEAIAAASARSTAPTRMCPCAVRPQPRTCPPRPFPGSRRSISTSAARTPSRRPAASAWPRFSPIAPSLTSRIVGLTFSGGQ